LTPPTQGAGPGGHTRTKSLKHYTDFMQKALYVKPQNLMIYQGRALNLHSTLYPTIKGAGPPQPSVLTCTISIFQCTATFYNICWVDWL